MEKLKDKIEGGYGHDNNMSALGDFYNTVVRARSELTRFRKGKITIVSDAKTREAASKGYNIIDKRYLKGKISTFTDKKTKKRNLVFDEGEYIENRKWVKEWQINDNLYCVLIFENDKGRQIRTGVLTL